MSSNDRIYEALLTGVPYGFFKFLSGWCLVQEQFTVLGYIFMLVGVVDICLNLVGIFKPQPFPLCTLVLVGRRVRPRSKDELFLGLDTLVAFIIVSYMIWFGWIPILTPTFGRLWDICVILNIVSVGVARAYAGFRQQGKTGSATTSEGAH
mgnify:CR=1 FL=1